MKLSKAISALFLSTFILLTSCGQSDGDRAASLEGKATQEKEGEIRKVANSYVSAINSRDTGRVASFWDTKAVYKNPISGELIQGRDGIKKIFSELFHKLKNATVEMKIQTVQFPYENKAVANGILIIKRSPAEDIESPYKIILIKKENKWLIQHVSAVGLSKMLYTQKASNP